MAVLSNTGIRAGASGAVSDPYRVKRSARFNDDNSAYLNRTTSTAGNKKTWTISLWFKRSSGFGVEQGLFNSGVGGHPSTFLKIDTSDRLEYGDYQSGYLCQIVTNHRFRDPSAWYHLIIVVDTTQAAEANRFKLYINGVQETSFSTANYYSQNDDTDWNNAEAHTLATKSTDEYDGYLADIYFIDGSAKAATDFAETNEDTGQWVPKEYSGSYGTNGFHLAMDPANGGTLHSNEVTGTPYNNDSTNYGGIPMFDGGDHNKYGQAANGGSLTWTPSGGMAFSSTLELRLWRAGTDVITIVHAGGSTDVSSQITNGQWFKWTVTGITSPITSINWTSTDGSSNFIALHSIYIDGRRLVDYSTIGYDSSGNNNHWHENNLFGNEHTTASENFKTVLYEGNNGTTTVNVGFQPDLVWIKGIDETLGHNLYDSVRGDYRIMSDRPDAQSAWTALDITSTGFTIADDAAEQNKSGYTYAAWCWKGGGTGVANDTGTLDSTVSANTTTGFSIVKWNSSSSVSTVGHGLGKVPKMIITKNLDASNTWWTYHEGTGNTHAMRLDTTDTKTDQQSNWNDTSPTSSVFTVGGEWGASNDVIAYCWSEIEGHSKFGSYSGGTNPRVIDCGFTPAFVLIKRTDTANYWMMIDSVRGGTQKVAANSTVAENDLGTLGDAAQNIVVFEPNGFKLTTTNAGTNTSGGTYIYAAFAGNPGGDLDLLADAPGAPYDNELNGGGNYCTMNPLDNGGNTLSNGNLTVTSVANYWYTTAGTIGISPSSGKFYWEVGITGVEYHLVDLIKQGGSSTGGSLGSNGWGYRSANGNKYNDANGAGGGINASYGATYGPGDTIGVAYDATNGQLTFYKNGTSQGVAFTLSTSETYFPAVSMYGGTAGANMNFGQRPFAYTPPAGYKALNTYNLTDPTITKGNTGFDVLTYTGDGAATRTLTGLEFDPDMIWLKNRSSVVDHNLWDEVRGMGANKELVPNDTYSEGETGGGKPNTDAWGFIHDTTSDGFIVKEGTSGASVCNTNNDTYVAWAWDAGTANVSKAAGDLNSVSYNQAATWSNDLESADDSYWSGNVPTGAFDGNTATFMATANLGTTTFDPGTDVPITSSFEVYQPAGSVGSRTQTWAVDGATLVLTSATNGTWVSGPNLVGKTISSSTPLTVTIGSGSGEAIYFGSLRIDGKLLVDSGVTVTNVPSIASTYRANPNTGFSIVTCSTINQTAETIAHGLNAVPALIIQKARTSGAMAWSVYHQANGPDKNLNLNTADTVASVTDYWGSSNPTSQVFGVAAGNNGNNQASPVYYCWSEVAGYSKFGSYEGNNSTDGSFVYLGFRPALVIVKNIDTGSTNWEMWDSKRPGYNLTNLELRPNQTNAEYASSANCIDILSNGFKLRGTDSQSNSAATFVYAAWAVSPFKYNNAH